MGFWYVKNNCSGLRNNKTISRLKNLEANKNNNSLKKILEKMS